MKVLLSTKQNPISNPAFATVPYYMGSTKKSTNDVRKYNIWVYLPAYYGLVSVPAPTVGAGTETKLGHAILSQGDY